MSELTKLYSKLKEARERKKEIQKKRSEYLEDEYEQAINEEYSIQKKIKEFQREYYTDDDAARWDRQQQHLEHVYNLAHDRAYAEQYGRE